MTSKDLKDLLGTVAAEGRDTVDLDEQQLVPRIRSRRRRQRIIVAAAGLGTAAVIAAAAVAIVPNLGTGEPTVASGTGLEANGVAIGDCGGPVSGQPRADQPLKLAAAGTLVPSSNADFARIKVNVTNTTGAPVTLTTGNSAQITVVQQGKVVATPAGTRDLAVQVVLAAGETKSIESTVSLRRCGEAATQTKQRLEPGAYELYATQRFSPTDGGQLIEAQSGPWTVELN
jgi:hypothetical protein